MGAFEEIKVGEEPSAAAKVHRPASKLYKGKRYVHKVDPSKRLPPQAPPKIPVTAWIVLVIMLIMLLFILLADFGAPPFDKDTADEIPIMGKGVAPTVIGLVTLCYFSILLRRCLDHQAYMREQQALQDGDEETPNPLSPSPTSYGT